MTGQTSEFGQKVLNIEYWQAGIRYTGSDEPVTDIQDAAEAAIDLIGAPVVASEDPAMGVWAVGMLPGSEISAGLRRMMAGGDDAEELETTWSNAKYTLEIPLP